MQDFIVGLWDFMTDSVALDYNDLIIKGDWLSAYGVNKLFKYFALFAMGLTVIYFLIEVNKKIALEGNDVTLRGISIPFIKLFISVCILMNSPTIIVAAIGACNSFVTVAGDGTIMSLTKTEDTEQWQKFMEAIDFMKTYTKGQGILVCVGLLLVATINWLISMVLKLVWWFKSLVYKMELLFRIAVAPFAFADVYSGQNSQAARYVKGLLALGIYGASLILLPQIGQQLGLSTVFDAMQECIDNEEWLGVVSAIVQYTFVVPFAALSCSNLVRTAAKEALGA